MKKFSITLITLLAFYFLACSTASSDQKKIPEKTLTNVEIQKCKEDGGVIKNVGLMAIPKCVITYSDAGKACKNSSECTKSCVTMQSNIQMGTKVSGECQRDNALYGCYSVVEEGVAGPRLCAD